MTYGTLHFIYVQVNHISKAKDAQSQSFVPRHHQVVTVQATNLTSQEMYLTLLAPSSLAASPLSVISFPTNDTPLATRGIEQQHSLTVREVLALEDDGKGSIQKLTPQLSSRRLSLPPVQPMEMVLGVKPTVQKERIVSPADAVADNSSPRTHLWLQSTVPLGYSFFPSSHSRDGLYFDSIQHRCISVIRLLLLSSILVVPVSIYALNQC